MRTHAMGKLRPRWKAVGAAAALAVLCGVAYLYLLRADRASVVYEAVIRYHIEHELAGTRVEALFVSIAGHGPGWRIVRAFRHGRIVVKPMSASGHSKLLGAPLELFGIKWHGKAEAEVTGQVLFLPMASHGVRYRLARRNGRWIVTSAQRTWVS